MRKIIIIDMGKVTNQSDVVLRIRKSLRLFNFHPENYFKEKVVHNENDFNWDALSDEMSSLTHCFEIRPKEVLLIFTHYSDLVNVSSKEFRLNLLELLSSLTDPAQRVDGIDFMFQLRLAGYRPYEEDIHNKFHSGAPMGKDIHAA